MTPGTKSCHRENYVESNKHFVTNAMPEVGGIEGNNSIILSLVFHTQEYSRSLKLDKQTKQG